MESPYTHIVAEERLHQAYEFLRHAQYLLPAGHEAQVSIASAMGSVGREWRAARVSLDLLVIPDALMLDNNLS